MYNASFWRRYFAASFKPHLERVLQALERRVLPAFDGISNEATALRDNTFDELMALPDGRIGDSSLLADAAFEAGYDHYVGMQAVRQSLINSFAPLLYHSWEQQLLTFHRREILHPAEQRDKDLLSLRELRARLDTVGIDICRLATWASIKELKLVANTVKHADGESADHLKKRRGELFDPEHANRAMLPLPIQADTRRVYLPMSGEDLYLTLADLKAYGSATIRFWDEFADALERG